MQPASRWFKTVWIVAAVSVLANVALIGFWIGRAPSAASPNDVPLILRADSASGGKSVSVATGRIDGDIEGLFVLDHLTGNLFCTMLSPRTGQQVGLFQTNVTLQLGDRVGDPDFAMATGYIELGVAGRTGNVRPAQCVCYVSEGNSGRVLAYTLQFDRQRLQNAVPQEGPLQLIWQGSIRAPGLRRD